MRTLTVLAVLWSLLGAACGGDPDPRESAGAVLRALGGVPLYPRAGISDVSGEGEAARATLHIPVSPDSAAAWYRRTLINRGWTMVSDVTARDSVTTIHATYQGRPIWLLFSRDARSPGSLVTVIGAIPRAEPDSAGQTTQRR
jgi:hypothetical protein